MPRQATIASTAAQPTIESVRDDVNLLLDEFYARGTERAATLHASYGRLWAAMHANHRAGGKRLRPYVTMLAYWGLGGTHYARVLPAAAALELLHASLLAHDDIIDRDYVRHGVPNIAGQYQAIYRADGLTAAQITHYADGAALLGGDLLLAGAHQLINRSALLGEQKSQALELLGEAMFVVAGGELLDTEAAFLTHEGTSSLQIAQLKTAHYSFVTAFSLGATLAGAEPAVVQRLARAGRAIGVAFQLADDLLGVFGDEAVTGKSTINDLAEGKRTYLIERALAQTDAAGQQLLRSTLGNPQAPPADILATKALLVDCGAKADTEAVIVREHAHALQLLADIPLNPAAQQSLRQLLDQLAQREV